jgi:hypothetical protein
MTKAKGSQGCGPRRVWEGRLTLPSELSFWELESWWTPEPSRNDCKGQNTSHWGVLYIIGNLLKCRCLKWSCMTLLDIYNTSYGKKKSWESNCQFDSWPQKGWESTRLPCVQMECDTPLEGFWQELQLCFRPHPNQRSQQDVMFPQSCGSPTLTILGFPFWGVPKQKGHLGGGLAERRIEYYMGEGGGFPRVWAVVSLVSPKSPVACPSTKGVTT